jgi:hypothetical protein
MLGILETRCWGLAGGVGSPDASPAFAVVGEKVAASGLKRPDEDRCPSTDDDELLCSMLLLWL